MLKAVITLVAISFIAGLEILALNKGFNGLCLATSVAIIGGLAGFRIGKLK